MMVDNFEYRHGPCIKSNGSIMPCQPCSYMDKCIGCKQYESALRSELDHQAEKKKWLETIHVSIDSMSEPELNELLKITDITVDENPKPYSLVKWNGDEKVYDKYYRGHFSHDKLLFISEVSNMKDHCMLCDLITGKIVGPYHTENFRMLTADEV